MIKKIDVGYIGFSLTMLSELLCSPFFNLKECILEETRCTDQIRTICKTNHVKLFEARNKKHLSEILIQESEENVFIMYENGIIIENAALCGKHIYKLYSSEFHKRDGDPVRNWHYPDHAVCNPDSAPPPHDKYQARHDRT